MTINETFVIAKGADGRLTSQSKAKTWAAGIDEEHHSDVRSATCRICPRCGTGRHGARMSRRRVKKQVDSEGPKARHTTKDSIFRMLADRIAIRTWSSGIHRTILVPITYTDRRIIGRPW